MCETDASGTKGCQDTPHAAAGASAVPDPQQPRRLSLPGRPALGYHLHAGAGPTIVFLGGFASTMDGTKASFLDERCRAEARAFLRFDYRGHGASDGAFVDATIGEWRDDALAMLDEVVHGPCLLVGSSMGAWIATLAARARPGRVAGMVTVAAAPDFTELLLRPALTATQKADLARQGWTPRPSRYGDGPYPIGRRLVEEGQHHRVLTGPIDVPAPLRALHGLADPDVPFGLSLRLVQAWRHPDAEALLVKDGDHRLSRPEDLERLADVVDRLWRQVRA